MHAGRPTHTSYPIAMPMYISQYTYGSEMVGEKGNKSVGVGGGLWLKATPAGCPRSRRGDGGQD